MPTDSQTVAGIAANHANKIPDLATAKTNGDLEEWAQVAYAMLSATNTYCKSAPSGDPHLPNIPPPPAL